jgi:hypothetical protein
MEYKNLYKCESFGDDLSLGIEINVAAPVHTETLGFAANRAAEIIQEEITRQFHKSHQPSIERAMRQKEELLKCFPVPPVYVAETSNGYCNRACCEHLKWFQAHTKIGIILIGWRKSVINIDWSATKVRRVISTDDVTKSEIMIHAWGYDKAREYLADLLE